MRTDRFGNVYAPTLPYGTRAPIVMTSARRAEWIEKLSEAFVVSSN